MQVNDCLKNQHNSYKSFCSYFLVLWIIAMELRVKSARTWLSQKAHVIPVNSLGSK